VNSGFAGWVMVILLCLHEKVNCDEKICDKKAGPKFDS